MKKIIIATAALFLSSFLFAAEPTAKVLESFEKAFQNAKDVRWFDHEGFYEVRFTYNEIQSQINYDADGNILKTIRYYKGENLPLSVQAKLNNRFKGKTVFGVTEISQDEKTNYYIVLEDATHWVHINADSYGGMYIKKKFKKA
jgi:hypothetical protein